MISMKEMAAMAALFDWVIEGDGELILGKELAEALMEKMGERWDMQLTDHGWMVKVKLGYQPVV